MSWHFPTTETVHSGPTGTVATAADFASYLGGIEDVATATVQLDLMIASATARIEQVLGYSFRARTFRVDIPKGNRCLAIWLPWGPASTVTVTVDGADFTDFETERRYRHVDFIAVDTAEAYRIEWDVGSSTEYPPEFVLEVFRVAAHLWNMPGADGFQALMQDVRALLSFYNARPDWL